MRITSINGVFRSIGEWQVAHRWPLLVAVALVSLFCLAGIPRATFTNQSEDWFDDTEQVKVDSDHFKDIFGNDDSVMVLVQAPDVFAPEVLQAIDRLGDELLASVPYADKVTSLTTVSVPTGTDEGFEISSPFADGIPDDPDQLAEKKAFLLGKSSLKDHLVSSDATETWVVLSLLPYDTDSEEAMIRVGDAARGVIESGRYTSSLYTMKATGMSYTEAEENIVVNHETRIRVMGGFGVMLLCLVILVRSFRGVVIPILATFLGIGSVFGLSGWLGVEGNSTLVTLPVLLGMALSVGYAIHLIDAFRTHFRRSGRRRQSAVDAVCECGWPILFTVLTTVVSLLSFLLADMKPIRWLGCISAGVVLAVYLSVMVLVPVFMSFGRDRKPSPEAVAVQGATRADLLFGRFGRMIIARGPLVIAIFLAVIAWSVPGLACMGVNMDYTQMMGKRIPYVARMLDILNSRLGSQYSYDVLVECPQEGAFKQAGTMESLEQLERYLGTLGQTKVTNGQPRTASVVRLVKEMHRTLNGDDEACYAIPEDDDLLAQELFLYEISDPETLFAELDEDYRYAHIHVELNGYDANQILKDISSAKSYGQSLFPEARVSVVGQVVEYAAMNGKVVSGELKSFGGSLVVVAILLMWVFQSVLTGLVAMIPNIVPVLLVGGTMGWTNTPLDMMTMTIMPMILGIAVDDTIHLTSRIRFEMEDGTTTSAMAVERSFREIGKTMGMTTLILCSMFLVYCFSPMMALLRIGTLSIIGLGSALVADYTLTPVLINLLFKNNGKREERRNA